MPADLDFLEPDDRAPIGCQGCTNLNRLSLRQKGRGAENEGLRMLRIEGLWNGFLSLLQANRGLFSQVVRKLRVQESELP